MLTELREELRRRGAPTHGRYEELVARLDALVVAEVDVDAIDAGVDTGGLSRESRTRPSLGSPRPRVPSLS